MPISKQELQMAQIEAEFFSNQDIFPAGAAYCVSNPHLTDCPVVYASPTFCAQTGYSLEEITGKNCRFLQVSASNSGRLDASMCLPRRVTAALGQSVSLQRYPDDPFARSARNQTMLASVPWAKWSPHSP